MKLKDERQQHNYKLINGLIVTYIIIVIKLILLQYYKHTEMEKLPLYVTSSSRIRDKCLCRSFGRFSTQSK